MRHHDRGGRSPDQASFTATGGACLEDTAVEWKELRHAYGSAWDIPGLFQRAASSDSASEWTELWIRLCHQGTVYSASYPSLPSLFEIASSAGDSAKRSPVSLAAAIVGARDFNGPAEAFRLEDYSSVVNDLRALADGLARSVGQSPEDFLDSCQALLALERDPVWGHHLSDLASGELEGECEHCGTSHDLVIGRYGDFATTSDWVGRPQTPRHDLEPRDPETMPALGQRLVALARAARATAIESRLRFLFGSFRCLQCGRRQGVSEAVERSYS